MVYSVCMDFIMGLPESRGCTNLLVITDRLSKGVILKAFDKIDAERLKDVFLHSFVRRHGFPSAITSDRGTQFVRTWWKRSYELLGIQKTIDSSPPSDRRINRANESGSRGIPS